MTQEEADLYWSTREIKKWVITMKARTRTVYGPLVMGRMSSKRVTPRRQVFISARTRERALECAKHSLFSNEPYEVVGIRLARPFDLGCVRAPA